MEATASPVPPVSPPRICAGSGRTVWRGNDLQHVPPTEAECLVCHATVRLDGKKGWLLDQWRIADHPLPDRMVDNAGAPGGFMWCPLCAGEGTVDGLLIGDDVVEETCRRCHGRGTIPLTTVTL